MGQPLFVGSSSLLVPVLKAMVVLVDGAVIKLLVALSPGTALVLLPDLFFQILFKRCSLGLGGQKSVKYPDRREIENDPYNKFADSPPMVSSFMDVAHAQIKAMPGHPHKPELLNKPRPEWG
jgi:hypothetical protein